jgi:outer membrane protein OmpA-like peptidoglycan-associated protein
MRSIALIAAMLLVAGCSSPSTQLSLIQDDKDQLLATIREQRETIRALRSEDASKEARLAQAEKELARAAEGTRLSSRPADTPPTKPKAEPLPWRSPPKPAAPGAKTSSVAGPSLTALASREGRIQIDRQSGAARLDANIPFAEGQAVLTGEGKRQLDEIARMLKTKEFEELRVMVAGYAEGRPAGAAQPADRNTAKDGEKAEKYESSRQLAAARAQAVADYLDRHGIAQERLGVTSLGSRGPLGTMDADRLAAAGSVQIFLLEPDATVVGWGPTGEAIRR